MSRIYAQQKRPGTKAAAPSYDAPAVHAPSLVSGQSSSDLDALMQAKYRQHFLDNQIPTAEAEADRIAASVSGARTPEEVKTQLGEKMGADFSNVTFHTDSAALKQADAMGARAYTSGSDVYFGSGGFDPGVAAHELVHTVQQGMVGSTMGTTSAPTGGVQMKPEASEEYAARFAGLSAEELVKELAKLNRYLHAASQTRKEGKMVRIPNEKYDPEELEETYKLVLSKAMQNKNFRFILASEAAISRANFQADFNTAKKTATREADAYVNGKNGSTYTADFNTAFDSQYKKEEPSVLNDRFDQHIVRRNLQANYGILTADSGKNKDTIKESWKNARSTPAYEADRDAYFNKHMETKLSLTDQLENELRTGIKQTLYDSKYSPTLLRGMNDERVIQDYETYERLLDDAEISIMPGSQDADDFRSMIGGKGHITRAGEVISRDRTQARTFHSMYRARAGQEAGQPLKDYRLNYDLPEDPSEAISRLVLNQFANDKKGRAEHEKQLQKAKKKEQKKADKAAWQKHKLADKVSKIYTKAKFNTPEGQKVFRSKGDFYAMSEEELREKLAAYKQYYKENKQSIFRRKR